MNKVNFGAPLCLAAFGLLLLATTSVAFGQVTQRNILTGRYTADDIRRVLIPRDKWQPYPRSSAEWRQRLPSGVVDELTISIERPSTEGPEYSSFATKWDSRPIKRIVLTATRPQQQGKISYLIKTAL